MLTLTIDPSAAKVDRREALHLFLLTKITIHIITLHYRQLSMLLGQKQVVLEALLFQRLFDDLPLKLSCINLVLILLQHSVLHLLQSPVLSIYLMLERLSIAHWSEHFFGLLY